MGSTACFVVVWSQLALTLSLDPDTSLDKVLYLTELQWPRLCNKNKSLHLTGWGMEITEGKAQHQACTWSSIPQMGAIITSELHDLVFISKDPQMTWESARPNIALNKFPPYSVDRFLRYKVMSSSLVFTVNVKGVWGDLHYLGWNEPHLLHQRKSPFRAPVRTPASSCLG